MHNSAPPVPGDSPTHAHLERPMLGIRQSKTLVKQIRRWREDERLARAQAGNMVEAIVWTGVVTAFHDWNMLLDCLPPLWAGEAVDDSDRAEVDESWRDGRFLGGDDGTDAQVALLADDVEEGFRELLGCGCIGHVLFAVSSSLIGKR